MATLIPSPARAARVWSWKEATDWPWSGRVTVRPSRVWMCSWWSTKSKSIQKTGLPSIWPMGRVVVPRPVRWKGTFHQWLRRTLAASRSLPMTWQNRCRVCLVSRHSANGIGGNSSRPGPLDPDGPGAAGGGNLQEGQAAHVQPGGPGATHQPQEDLVADWAAGDHPGGVVEPPHLGHGCGASTAAAAPDGGGDLDPQHVLEGAGEGIA